MQHCGLRPPGSRAGCGEAPSPPKALLVPSSQASTIGVPNGDAQPRAALVSESEEEEVGGPRRTTRWVPARAVEPRTPEEVEILKGEICALCALLLRWDGLRFYKRASELHNQRRSLHDYFNELAEDFKVLTEEEVTP